MVHDKPPPTPKEWPLVVKVASVPQWLVTQGRDGDIFLYARHENGLFVVWLNTKVPCSYMEEVVTVLADLS